MGGPILDAHLLAVAVATKRQTAGKERVTRIELDPWLPVTRMPGSQKSVGGRAGMGKLGSS